MGFFRVREAKVDDLRSWMKEIEDREGEVLETFRNEGTRHERAFLLEGSDGPVLVYVMEVDDPEKARRAYADSKLPIDAEHRRVMGEVLVGGAEAEELLNISARRER
ncbi:DUF6176 family protein [Rubrobacter marinus]|nr:DUF6176 family protein [Rubrobacter marinus]